MRDLRKKHGLTTHGMIAPVDVIDHLYTLDKLKQELFAGVFGGSILDPDHIGNLFDALQAPMKDELIGAIVYFKEHVTSILRRAAAPPWVPPAAARAAEGGGYDFVDSNAHKPQNAAVRIWCADIETLRLCLLWFACRQLTPDNQRLIGSKPFNVADAESDPRTFQAFAWHNRNSGNKMLEFDEPQFVSFDGNRASLAPPSPASATTPGGPNDLLGRIDEKAELAALMTGLVPPSSAQAADDPFSVGPPPVPIVAAKKWEIQIGGLAGIEVCDKNGQLVIKRVAPQITQSLGGNAPAPDDVINTLNGFPPPDGMTSMAFCAVVSQQPPPIRIGFERK